MWVKMVQHKTSDQSEAKYQLDLSRGSGDISFYQRFRRYKLLKALTKNFFSNADTDINAEVTAIALSVLSYRRANKKKKKKIVV